MTDRQLARTLYILACILFLVGLFTNYVFWGFSIILVVVGFKLYIDAEFEE